MVAMSKVGFLGLALVLKDAQLIMPFCMATRKILKIAIVLVISRKNDLRPCGACLQYISDFANSLEIRIITAKVQNERILFQTVKLNTLEELLPFLFGK